MARLASLLTIVAAFFAICSNALNICQYFGGTPLQCQICGYTPSAPVYCVAYNATFDDLPANKPVPLYGNTKWPGFTTLAPSKLPSINGGSAIKAPTPQVRNAISERSSDDVASAAAAVPVHPAKRDRPKHKAEIAARARLAGLTVSPASPPNWAYVAPNTNGTMQFGFEGGVAPIQTNGQYPAGALHYFAYACVLPNTNPPIATACTITIQGVCLPTNGYNFITGPFTNLSETITYDPSLLPTANASSSGMAFYTSDFATTGANEGVRQNQICSNYTFSAVGALGVLGLKPAGAVGLVLDDIVYNTYAKGYQG